MSVQAFLYVFVLGSKTLDEQGHHLLLLLAQHCMHLLLHVSHSFCRIYLLLFLFALLAVLALVLVKVRAEAVSGGSGGSSW